MSDNPKWYWLRGEDHAPETPQEALWFMKRVLGSIPWEEFDTWTPSRLGANDVIGKARFEIFMAQRGKSA